MKNLILTVCFIAMVKVSFAQWVTSGSNSTTSNNVGIGTASPAAQLHNKGQAIFGVNRTAAGPSSSVVSIGANEFISFAFSDEYPAGDHHRIGKWFANDPFALQYISVGADRPTDKAHWFKTQYDQNAMIIKANGYVGIGTSAPDQRLTIKGKIHAEEVKVDLSVPGPDYVFETGYELQSLENVEKYINSNKHLPGIPTAKTLQDEGISLGNMQMKLLEKIEELTLHLIEMNKSQKLLEQQVKRQQNEIERLNSSK